MLIPSDLAQDAARMFLMGDWANLPIETNAPPLAGQETPILSDPCAWPTDCSRPPFAVGGVYTFADVYGRQRTALVYTEQQARVDGSWWHVSELPEDAQWIASFTPDAETVADAKRFAREVENSQVWS